MAILYEHLAGFLFPILQYRTNKIRISPFGRTSMSKMCKLNGRKCRHQTALFRVCPLGPYIIFLCMPVQIFRTKQQTIKVLFLKILHTARLDLNNVDWAIKQSLQ